MNPLCNGYVFDKFIVCNKDNIITLLDIYSNTIYKLNTYLNICEIIVIGDLDLPVLKNYIAETIRFSQKNIQLSNAINYKIYVYNNKYGNKVNHTIFLNNLNNEIYEYIYTFKFNDNYELLDEVQNTEIKIVENVEKVYEPKEEVKTNVEEKKEHVEEVKNVEKVYNPFIGFGFNNRSYAFGFY